MEEFIQKPSFTHREMAITCFNKVWDLLGLENRSQKQSEEMVHLCHSSFWHWTQVQEHTPTNLSIGYWQLSRVYAVTGKSENALHYAKECIEISANEELEPFYKAYAYEAAARAYKGLEEAVKCNESLETAFHFTSQVVDDESKGWLTKDLDDLKKGITSF